VFDERGPGGTRLGAFVGYGVVWLEGRLSALLSGDAGSWALCPKVGLQAADTVAREALERIACVGMFGARECSDGELRRYDLAFEHQFGHGPHGLAFLRTCAELLVPGRKTDVWRGPDGQVQTVYWRTPKRGVVTERIYDKGVESGSHAPGERIRIEVQRRPARAKRQRPAIVARRDLAPEFGRQMAPYLSEDVVATGLDGAVDELVGKALRGELSMAKMERLVGTLDVLRRYGRAVYPDERQQRRRVADVRNCGVVVDEALPPGATVPVGQLLREAVEAFRA